ncbi:MAG: hypothetical protein K6F99_02935 [Lachnospiraceae bacterium]|nr:hypothetical protein [Lachnospiraceae bacterium]
MKAVVLKNRGHETAVLDESGIVTIIENKDYIVGQVLRVTREELDRMDISSKTIESSPAGGKITDFVKYVSKYSARIASVACAVLCVGAVTAYAAPYSIVTLDINPSVKYTLNMFDKVIGMEAMNDDGEALTDNTSPYVMGQGLEGAVENTLNSLKEESYIEDENVPVVVGVSLGDKNEELKDKVIRSVEKFNENNKQVSVELNTVDIDKAQENAAEMPGRKMLNEINEERAKESMILIEEVSEQEQDTDRDPVTEDKKDIKEKPDNESEKPDEDGSANNREDNTAREGQADINATESESEKDGNRRNDTAPEAKKPAENNNNTGTGEDKNNNNAGEVPGGSTVQNTPVPAGINIPSVQDPNTNTSDVTVYPGYDINSVTDIDSLIDSYMPSGSTDYYNFGSSYDIIGNSGTTDMFGNGGSDSSPAPPESGSSSDGDHHSQSGPPSDSSHGDQARGGGGGGERR